MVTNNLVVEKVLLHKRCNTNFFSKMENQHSEGDLGRKPDEGCLELFKELCNWLEVEMEDNLFALDQVHGKLVSFEKTLDKALAYKRPVT